MRQIKTILFVFSTIIIAFTINSCKKNTDIPIAKQLPVADFTFNIQNGGTLPTRLTFTSTSKFSNGYQWIFGDGNVSSNPNPEHSYTTAGTYSVKLIVINSDGKDSITKTITISPAISIDPILNSVVVYLVTPKDKSVSLQYYNALKSAVQELQVWYKTQMGNNKTFVLNPWIVDTVKGLHNASWYDNNNGSISGTDPRFYGYYNTYNDMQQLLGSKFNTTNYTYVVYVATPFGGAGAKGFCAMGEGDLTGLLGTNPENLNPKRWIGGGGHELGHAFGLPHPDNKNDKALMWLGYLTYPNCILQQEDKNILNSSPFFK